MQNFALIANFFYLHLGTLPQHKKIWSMVSIVSTKYEPTKVGKTSFSSSSVLLRFKDHRRRGRGGEGREIKEGNNNIKQGEGGGRMAEWQIRREGGCHGACADWREGGRGGEDEE